MNKKVIFIVLLLFIPMVINASCNRQKHEEYANFAPNITYDNNYSKSADKFNVVIYNIFDGMSVKYGSKTYKPDQENKVTIDGIAPGENARFSIYADDGCDEIKIINVNEAYFNPFYGTSDCFGYEEKLIYCSAQFTTSRVTRELLEEAKKNKDNCVQCPREDKPKEEKDSILTTIKNFIQKWGIKIVLVALTIFISSTLFNIKFRNIKHGI